MILSRLHIDPANRQTMKAMAEPKLFHGAIERAFADHTKRKLWRLDVVGGQYYLLVVSEDTPDFTAAAGQFGYAGEEDSWASKSYDGLLARVTEGTRWHFRLKANPTHHGPSPGPGMRGKVLAHRTAAMQEQWLLEKAPAHGFSLEPGAFTVVESTQYSFTKPRQRYNRVWLQAAVYEGVLTVTDGALFRKTLTQGMGRGKAYGMGMLTVARQEVPG